jgi:nucleotide-binding universal stress UspA family protein
VGRIVVGVDGSEPSRAALRWAARLAPGIGATIEAVIAWEFPTNFGWAVETGDWRPDRDAETILNETLDAVFGSERPDGLVGSVREGRTASVLLEAARGAEMLIIGSRGHGGFTGLLLGSVSAECAEHASCPVLVVHG